MIARPVLGLVSHNARLVLDEGSVPTAVFGLICPGSLATPKPLMYRLAMEFIGPGTRQGREFTGRWQYPGFRRVFRVITTAWGTAYLAEAVARVVIVPNTSTGTALVIPRCCPTRWPLRRPPGRPATAGITSARVSAWPPQPPPPRQRRATTSAPGASRPPPSRGRGG